MATNPGFQLFRIKPFGWGYNYSKLGILRDFPKVSNYSELNHSVGRSTLTFSCRKVWGFQLFRIKPFGWVEAVAEKVELIYVVSNYSELNHSVGDMKEEVGEDIRTQSFQLFRIKPFGWARRWTRGILFQV